MTQSQPLLTVSILPLACVDPAGHAASLATSNAAAEALMREDEKEKATAQRKKDKSHRRKHVKQEALRSSSAIAEAAVDLKDPSGKGPQDFQVLQLISSCVCLKACISEQPNCAQIFQLHSCKEPGQGAVQRANPNVVIAR